MLRIRFQDLLNGVSCEVTAQATRQVEAWAVLCGFEVSWQLGEPGNSTALRQIEGTVQCACICRPDLTVAMVATHQL